MLGQPMVRSRLKALISEQNTKLLDAGRPKLTIRTISEESDVPVSVITRLNGNHAGRVDFETLNKLCRYFNCTPGDILVYTPDDQAK